MDNNLNKELHSYDLKPKKSLGQNFLKDETILNKIADLCEDPDQCIFEIGAGTGVLTEKLSDKYKKVLSFEIDKTLMPLLENKFNAKENVKIVFEDFMKIDLDAFILENHLENEKISVCTNLPYYISSDATYKLLEYSKYFSRIIMLVQKEFADKICLNTGDRDCIPLTFVREYKTSCKKCFNVPPHLFVPQPKVMSTVIKLTVDQKYNLDEKDEKLLFEIIEKAFLQRRKQLINSIDSMFGKEKIRAVLNDLKINENVRAEELKLADFIKIENGLTRLTNV